MKQENAHTKARAALLEAAFTTLAADPTASLADIARSAGMGRATLHRHFTGRHDLLKAMALQALEELDAAVDAATRDATSYTDGLRLSLDAMIPLASRHAFLASDTLERDPDIAAAFAESAAELANAIDAARDEGTFAADVPTAWIQSAFDALLFSAWERVRAQDLTPRQASALAWRTLTIGLKGAPE